jgi:ketosteroid isomerase-like protein
MTTTRLAIAVAIVLALVTNARADALAIAKAHDERVNNAVKQCKPQDMIDLYENDAVAIFPGEGEIGRGKGEIAKIVNNFFTGFCPDKDKKVGYKDVSFNAIELSPKYIMIIRVVDVTDKDGNLVRLRTTELIHKSSGRWRYLIDHASIGVPPPPPAKSSH